MQRFWVWWSALAGGSFLIVETYALWRGRWSGEGTFCEFFRRVTGIKPAKPWRTAASAALGVFLAWFWAHIVTGKV